MNSPYSNREQERRKQERWPIVNYDILVYPKDSELPIGRVKDINLEGLRLLAERPFADDELNSFRLEKPSEDGNQEGVLLEANRIWSKSDTAKSLAETGLKFTNPLNAIPFIENLPYVPKITVNLWRYQEALKAIDKSLSKEKVLALLKSRDALQAVLDQSPQGMQTNMLLNIFELDRTLRRKYAKKITSKASLAEWRKSLYPPEQAWWWFLDQDTNWVLSSLSVVLTFLTVAGLVYILPRIFTGGLNGEIALFTILQTALTLAGAKGALTHTLPKTFEKFFIKAGVPEYHLNRVIFSFTLMSFVVVCGTYLSFPLLSDYYLSRGLQSFETKNYQKAMANYEKALALMPYNPQTRYYRALLYEDMQDLNAARSEYQLAVNSCIGKDFDICDAARLNLARLYILNKEYDVAISILERLEESSADAKFNYYIHKNWGWALFEQGHLERAEAYLLNAIDITKNSQDGIDKFEQASAYCILAQVSEKLGKDSEKTREYWRKCLDYNERHLPEEKLWGDMAQKKIAPEKGHSHTEGDPK